MVFIFFYIISLAVARDLVREVLKKIRPTKKKKLHIAPKHNIFRDE